MATGGALLLPEGAAGAFALAASGTLAGGLAAAADLHPCEQGNSAACVALVLGAAGGVAGLADLASVGIMILGDNVTLTAAASLALAGGAAAIDIGYNFGAAHDFSQKCRTAR